ncbi:hypothetical protein D3C87_1948420 [compost metagenome]
MNNAHGGKRTDLVRGAKYQFRAAAAHGCSLIAGAQFFCFTIGFADQNMRVFFFKFAQGFA